MVKMTKDTENKPKKERTVPLALTLTRGDIFALKQKAELQGLHYQTLAASVLHEYLNGTF